ncbi:DNA-directed RNA polymerase subunit omega [bacterium]|nr:DNA-directed RNA polymerase subunit omega [bacterium]
MDREIDMDKLRDKVGSAYKLVILASKRVRELNEGSPKLVETDSKDLTDIALEEIAAGKIRLRRKGSKK